MRPVRLACGGSEFEIMVGSSASSTDVRVDGQPFAPKIEEVMPGIFILVEGDHRETFHCVREGKTIHLFWKGQNYKLVPVEGLRGAQPSAGRLEAPMPGRVIQVRVSQGQRVRRGDELLVIEAMKMENSIRAPRDGVVGALLARIGDRVAPGVPLIELE